MKEWRYALGAAAFTLMPVGLSSSDGGLLAAILVALSSAIVLAILLVRKSRTRPLAVASTLGLYAMLAWPIFQNFYSLHLAAKWLLGSNEVRAQLASHRAPAIGQLRHLDWDGYGFAGLETDAFLVFDPSNALAAYTGRDRVGSVPGVPCNVNRVYKLETHYYAVLFYTDTDWNACTY